MKRPQYEIFQSAENDRWYWRLQATNGEIVAQSEAYVTQEGAYKGAKAARRNSRIAKIV